MVNTNQKFINCYINEEESVLFLEAARISGLSLSAFLRTSTLKEARKILREWEEPANDSP